MYIVSWGCSSPGIDPRTPTCWAGRRGCTRRSSPTAGASEAAPASSADLPLLGRCERARAQRAGRRGQRQRERRGTRAPRQAGHLTAARGMWLTIAEPAAPQSRLAGCGISCGVDTRSDEVVELLGRVPVFSTLVRDDLERIAQVAVPRTFEPGQVVFREGDASDTCYVVRDGHARAIRTPRRRAHDHARDVRPRRHLRRAGDVRGRAALGDGRGDRARRASWRCSARTCAG